jgi:hypothetical protein
VCFGVLIFSRIPYELLDPRPCLGEDGTLGQDRKVCFAAFDGDVSRLRLMMTSSNVISKFIRCGMLLITWRLGYGNLIDHCRRHYNRHLLTDCSRFLFNILKVDSVQKRVRTTSWLQN